MASPHGHDLGHNALGPYEGAHYMVQRMSMFSICICIS